MASKRASANGVARAIKLELTPKQVQKLRQRQRQVIGQTIRPVCAVCGVVMRSNKTEELNTFYYCFTEGCTGGGVGVKRPRTKLPDAEPPPPAE